MSNPTNLDDLPPLREVISAHNLRAEKSLGQNFLLDQNITDKIAKHAGDLTQASVIEIGPGPGGLTRSLLRAGAKKVIAVEFDERAINALQSLKNASQGRRELIHADALSTNISTLCDGPRVVVANLPYNIATPLLTGWLSQLRNDPSTYDQMILMFQKEVGDRITANVNTKAYGRLSIISQWICETKKLFDLPPSAFTPPPKIKSSVVRFIPRELPNNAPDFKTIETLTAAAFGQRRKMIRSSLKNYADQIESTGLDPQKRAENLSIDDFVNLAEYA